MPEDELDKEIDLSELDEIFEEATEPEKGEKTMNHIVLNNPEEAQKFYDYLAGKTEESPQLDNNNRKRIVIKGAPSKGYTSAGLLNALFRRSGFTVERKRAVTISDLNPETTNKVSSECSGVSNALSEVIGHRVYLGIFSSKKGYFKFYPHYVEVEKK